MIIIIFIVLAHLVLHAGSLVVSVSWVDGSWENEQVWQNFNLTKKLSLGNQNDVDKISFEKEVQPGKPNWAERFP